MSSGRPIMSDGDGVTTVTPRQRDEIARLIVRLLNEVKCD